MSLQSRLLSDGEKRGGGRLYSFSWTGVADVFLKQGSLNDRRNRVTFPAVKPMVTIRLAMSQYLFRKSLHFHATFYFTDIEAYVMYLQVSL